MQDEPSRDSSPCLKAGASSLVLVMDDYGDFSVPWTATRSHLPPQVLRIFAEPTIGIRGAWLTEEDL